MMSDFMFPIYLATNKIQKRHREKKKSERQTERDQRKTEGREARGRPRKTREAKLRHGNLQISKRFMYHYKDLININVR